MGVTSKMIGYTWTGFESDLLDFENTSKNAIGRYDVVIGISKGGLPLAVKVANILNLPLEVINAKSYSKKKQTELVVEQFNPILWGPRILLVDDICDSGNTLASITETLEIWKKEVETLTIFKRENSKFKPTHYIHTVEEGVWVSMPWE